MKSLPALIDKEQRLLSIQEHPLWHILTEKQREFLLAYLTTGDKEAAVKTCYKVGTRQDGAANYPSTQANRLLRHKHIRKLVAIYFGYEADLQQSRMTKEETIGLIADRLRNPKTSTHDFARLMDQLLEVTNRGKRVSVEAKDEEPEPDNLTDVDKIVRDMEKRG